MAHVPAAFRPQRDLPGAQHGIRQWHAQLRLRPLRRARPGHLCGAVGAGDGRAGPGHPRGGLRARQHPGACGRDPAQRLYRDLRCVAHGAHAGRRAPPDHRLRAARRLRRAHRNRAAPPRYRSHCRQPGVPHADGANAPATRALPAAGTQAAATCQHGAGCSAGHRPAAGTPATERTAGAFPAAAGRSLHPARRQRRPWRCR